MRTPPNEPLAPGNPGGRSTRGQGAPERSAVPGSGPGSGPGSAEAEPERRCVLSGQGGSRDALVRLAISPDGDVLPDALAKAPGRGAWIGVTRAELEVAMAKGRLKGALARAFKGSSLTIPEDLPARIEAALLRAFTDRLGLAMRSGKLVLGTDRIGEQARMGRVAWLAHAADAGEDGSRKLDQAWRVGRDAEGTGLGGMRLPLDRATLSVALGRDNVVHLALADRGSAERVMIPLQRLLHFTGSVAAVADDFGDRTAPVATRPAVATN